jgi:WhiB family redox-sensing transcriptional regulator
MVAALACSANPDLFFAELPGDVTRAKALCLDCPVQAACPADALDRGELGGELFLNGVVVRAKRARDRPRNLCLPVFGRLVTGRR